jgi:hypothetical protein
MFTAVFKRSRREDKVEGFQCQTKVTMEPTNQADESSFEEIYDNRGRQALLTELERIRYAGNRRVLRIHIYPNITESRLLTLAQKLDNEPLPLDIPNGYQRGDRFDIYYGFPNIQQGHIKLANQIPYHNFDSVETNHAGTFLYAWTPKDLYRLFATIQDTQKSQISLNPTSPGYAKLSPLLAARDELERYFHGQPHNLNHLDLQLVRTSDGCHRICRSKLTFRYRHHDFWLEKQYIYGRIVQQRLYMGSQDQTRHDAALVLAPNLQVSFAAWNEQILHSDNLKLQIRAHAYTSNLIEKSFYDAISWSEPTLDVQRNLAMMPTSLTVFREPMILFGTYDLTNPEIIPYLVRGPFASDSPLNGGSLLGWQAPRVNPEQSHFERFYEGVFAPWSQSDPDHTSLVIESMTADGTQPALIPLGYESLLNLDYQSTLHQTGARILVLPGTWPIEAEACSQRFSQRPPHLWILAAGNDGIENPGFRCPQNLHPPEKRLVVAATEGGRLSPKSDYGIYYADIAANGFAPNGQQGTSFAVPKVARVVDQMLVQFGRQLTPTEIRLALLLGVNYEPTRPLAVRSGGTLNGKRSMAVAQAILNLSFDQRDLLNNGSLARKRGLYHTILRNISPLGAKEIASQVAYLLQNKE